MESLLAGLALGVGSGVAPGPLLALALAVTLRRGLRGGLLVAAAPLASDVLIIAASLTLVANLPEPVVAGLSIVGGVVVLAFGLETARAARTADVATLREPDVPAGTRLQRLAGHPLAQATVLNLLNPAPWLFWVTAGAPLLVASWSQAPASAVAFLLAFYVGIVGSKALIVAGVAAGRHRLTTPAYRWLLVASALLLLVIGVLIIARGIGALVS